MERCCDFVGRDLFFLVSDSELKAECLTCLPLCRQGLSWNITLLTADGDTRYTEIRGGLRERVLPCRC